MSILMDWLTSSWFESRGSRIVPTMLLIAMLTSSCTDLPEPVEEGSGNSGGDEPGHDTEGGVQAEEGSAASSESLDAFPADVDDDDLAGLVVTGLDGFSAEAVVSPWLAVIRTYRSVSEPDQTGDGEVELVRYAEDFPVSAHLSYLDLPLDECQVRTENTSYVADGDDLPPPAISGGSTVVFNTPSGPWYTFNSTRSSDAQFVYQAVNELPGGFPGGITLSVPGLSFPTVPAYPLYEPQPVKRLSPDATQAATEDSHLQWIAGQHNTLVKIDWLAFDENDRFAGFPVTCLVRDDGAFAPDAVVRAALGVSRHRLAIRYSRVYTRLDVSNGIVFYQETEIAE